MPQSNSNVIVHLIFSTKGRRPFLVNKEVMNSLHNYLSAVSKQKECPSIIIGGTEDHVHILARLSRSITQSDWVKELKRVSTLWLKNTYEDLAEFSWQNGYAIFSVSQSIVPKVIRYISEQETHHKKANFQDEMRVLFQKHEISFDERYVWD